MSQDKQRDDMQTLMEQLKQTTFKETHTDLLSVGKCDKCKVAFVWLKKSGSRLSETKCTCGDALKRTTFLSTLKLEVKA